MTEVTGQTKFATKAVKTNTRIVVDTAYANNVVADGHNNKIRAPIGDGGRHPADSGTRGHQEAPAGVSTECALTASLPCKVLLMISPKTAIIQRKPTFAPDLCRPATRFQRDGDGQ